MVTYSESGVDIDLEAETVKSLASKLQSTLDLQNVITDSGHFAALVELGDKAVAMSTDGVGSKILVAKMMEKYDTVGIDCIAMVVNDILCVGAEPIALVDYLAVENPDPNIASEIAEGLVKGAEESNIAIIGGETASLPEIIKDFDLAGTGIGFVEKDKIITGKDIEIGDTLIGLKSTGIHSNGLSLARKVLFEDANLKINDKIPNTNITVGEELLKPTQLYVKPIIKLLKKDYNIHGLAHITGGGFTNLQRLKPGIGFNINNLPEPQELFKFIKEQNVSLKEMYKVFNMGIGFVIIAKKEEAEDIIKELSNDIEAYKIGEVISEDKIIIKTYTDEIIEY